MYRRHLNFYQFGLLIIILQGYSLQAQIQLHNDEFADGNTLQNWKDINAEEGWNIRQMESININDSTAGHLFMKPFTVSWYAEYRGAYFFKYVHGDFVVTTEITASGHDGISLPGSDYSLAGLMVRSPMDYPNQNPTLDWMPNEQNYIFMSIGQAVGAGFDFEIKNTCNSVSCLDIVPIDTHHITQIRMARIGQTILVLSRFPGENWVVRNRYNRSGTQCMGMQGSLCVPFPDTVQIGFVTYTDWDKVFSTTPAFHNTHSMHPDSLAGIDPSPGQPFHPDLIGEFDFLRFDSVAVPTALQGLDLTNSVSVPDSEILSFLGYDSQEFCPQSFHITELIDQTVVTTKAAISLSTEGIISNGSAVTLQAGDQVQFQNGFQIDQNSTLEVKIDDCSPTE